MSYPCPYCTTPATLDRGCPGCGRGPDADAAEVIRLDAEIARLGRQMDELRHTHQELWQRRHAAAERVRAAVAAAKRPAAPAPRPFADAPPAVAPRTKEASTRLVQNALFLLGGLLLGVAAIVFTAVAWAQFGVGGRAALLAGFTAAALAVPPLALRRGLTATAETFAAVGLLLVLLDGYAAWHVDLFGVTGYSAYGYAGAVCAVTAAVAAGYEHLTGLTGPRYAALVVAQPVLPLVVAPLEPDATGWSFTLAAVALLDLAVVHLTRGRLGGAGITAYAFATLAVTAAGFGALTALGTASTPATAALAGSALVTAALVVVAGAVSARIELIRAVAGGVLVLSAGVAAGRFCDVVGGEHAPLLIAAVVTVPAVAAAAARRVLTPVVARGAWAGALVLFVLPALVALIGVADAAARTVDAAQPFLRAGLDARVDRVDAQLLAVVAVLAVGFAALVPAAWWRQAALGAVALLVLTVPAVAALPWWAAPGPELVVAAVALAAAVRLRGPAGWAVLAAVPAGHAVTVGFGRPGVAAATLGAVVLIGAGVAVLAWPTQRRSGVGGAALGVALLAVPGVTWMSAAAAGVPGRWESRAALAGAVVVAAVAFGVGRRWSEYRPFASVALLLGVVTAPLWALGSGDSAAVYAAVGLILVATTVARVPPGVSSVPASASAGTVPVPGAAVPGAGVGAPGGVVAAAGFAAPALGVALVLAAGDSVLSVLAAPYGWLAAVWSGRPGGVGLDPEAVARVTAADGVAVALLGVAVAVVLRRDVRAAVWAAVPAPAVAVPMGLAAAGAVWPVVPGASLVIGLAGLLVAALRRPDRAGRLVAVVGGALAGAGLAGALATRGGTMAALGLVVAAGSAVGTAARLPIARLVGWPVAVGAAVALAFTAGRAGGLSVVATSLPVLAAAAVALAVGTVLSGRPVSGDPAAGSERFASGEPGTGGRRFAFGERWAGGGRAVEGRAVQVAAHAGAVVALLLTVGSARHAAAVCTLWGVALGVRALRPGERTRTRHVLVVAAAVAQLGAWWLLVAAERVATLEVYTLPAAAVALLAGRLALRSRRELTSWVAYGPALAAALLPTCASVLAADGQPMRRLALGVAALAVVLAGTYARLQAPVLIGGGVLAVVALHELVLVWDLLPRWIPLALAGLLLVALAMTLERRRRDLARMRAAIHRMT